ncbi:hypothetical protein Ddye_009770 [Dipteronia dyeriana]|uniref:Uncharacterized protein n=1 Tax=Dipteronia dyeriana TaxID=168575 RepID=A0AAD9XCA3_9ROSI|nr:hypothetical protein Ddye_009770 [Dipteronia dyeriana]
MGNCYEGCMTKWVNVLRCVSYDGLVKLVEDVVKVYVAKVYVARYNLQLWSLVFTISGTARPRIKNDNDVSCMMNVDKLLPEVFVSVSAKETTDCVQDDNLCNLPTSQPVYGGFLRQLVGYGSIPIVDPNVCNDETIDDEENNQWPDSDNSDDSSIPNVGRGSHDDEYWHNGVGCGSGSVRGHGCAGPSGFATFNGVSFRDDGLGDDVDQTSEHASPRAWLIPGAERYSFKPISAEKGCSNDGRLYKGRIFKCKKDLKGTLNMYALKEGFEVRIRRSSKTRYEAGCKDGEYTKKPLPDYCGDCYKTTSWVEAYAGTIFPVGHPSDWNIPEDVRSKVVLPPPFRAQAGRPRKKRFKSVGEHGNGKTKNCTICKKSGPNRQNCRNPQPCQVPPPCPSSSSATSVTSKRLRRPYRCRKCGDEGHNS